MSILTLAHAHGQGNERSFLLQRAQPAMTGLIDGSLASCTRCRSCSPPTAPRCCSPSR